MIGSTTETSGKELSQKMSVPSLNTRIAWLKKIARYVFGISYIMCLLFVPYGPDWIFFYLLALCLFFLEIVLHFIKTPFEIIKVRTRFPSLNPRIGLLARVAASILVPIGLMGTIFFLFKLNHPVAGLFMIIFFLGIQLYNFGKKHRWIIFKSAEKAIEFFGTHNIPMILYLRPFQLDYDEESLDSEGSTSPVESIIANGFKRTGQLVSIGLSNDEHLTLGSYRVISSHDTWWDDASKLISCASVIVIRPGAPASASSITDFQKSGIGKEFSTLPEKFSENQILIVIFRTREEFKIWNIDPYRQALKHLVTKLSNHPDEVVFHELKSLALQKGEMCSALMFKKQILSIFRDEKTGPLIDQVTKKANFKFLPSKFLPGRRVERYANYCAGGAILGIVGGLSMLFIGEGRFPVFFIIGCIGILVSCVVLGAMDADQ